LAHDSIAYLYELTSTRPVWYSHHLLWHVLAQGLGRVSHPLLSLEDAVIGINSLSGAGVIAIVYTYYKNRLAMYTKNALILASAVTVSYGVWTYSTVVEVYMLPLFWILLSLYLISQSLITSTSLMLTGLSHVLAVLFHQSHILFYPVVAYVLWQNRREIPWKKYGVFYLLGTGTLIVGVYLYITIIWAEIDTIAEAWKWVVGYGNDNQYWVGWNIGIFIKPVLGFARTFIGGQFILVWPGIEELLKRGGTYYFVNDRTLVKDIPQWLLMSIGGMVVGILTLAGRLIYQVVKNTSFTQFFGNSTIRICIVLWFSYAIFFIFWAPENLEFWLLQNVVFWLIMGYAWLYYGGKRRSLLTFCIALMLGVVNYAGSIHWQRLRAYDYYYQLVTSWEHTIPAKGAILLQDPWIVWGYVLYFTDYNYITQDQLSSFGCEQPIWVFPYTKEFADPKGKYTWACQQVEEDNLGICTCVNK